MANLEHGLIFINRGVGSETSTQVTDRLLADDERLKSWKLVVWMGRNDTGNSEQEAVVVANFARIVAARGNADRCIFIGPTPASTDVAGDITRIQETTDALALLYPTQFIDYRDVFTMDGDFIDASEMADAVHMNSDGYDLMAAEVLSRLQAMDA